MEISQVLKFQKAQLVLLREVDKICRELDIGYYMIGGTLLGAVRHKGFIPWDPDIDLAMRRSDYEKFRKYWEDNPSDIFFYQDYRTEKNHLSPHALLRIKGTHVVMQSRCAEKWPVSIDGIYLDIFPLDEAPEGEAEQKRQMQKIKRIRRIIEFKAGYTYGERTGKLKRIAKRMVQFCLNPVSITYLNEKLHQAMQAYSGCNSGYLVSMASRYSYRKQLMHQDIYGEPQRIVFEDGEYCAPAEVDAYLKKIYGDYMKLPPVEDRLSGLDMIAYVDYGSVILE